MTGAEIAALVMAGVAAAGLIVNARRTTADTATAAVSALADILAEVATLREQVETSKDQEEDCRARMEDAKRELATVMRALAATRKSRDDLQSAHPIMLAAGKIGSRSESVRKVLDACRDGIVLSEKSGGRLAYVNRAFASALGLTPDEVLAIGWRELIHPDDLAATESAESEAWSGGGETENRYRHRIGYFVKMKWHFTDYDDGHSLSVVWFERRRGSAPDLFRHAETREN